MPLASAQDYKRIFDDDRGPEHRRNGLVLAGAVGRRRPRARDLHGGAPARARRAGPAWDPVPRRVVRRPDDDAPTGFKVLEFNVRFGDPETQAILPRLRTDLLALLEAATVPGGLDDVALEWAPEMAVTVVLASEGYPASSSSGDVITGLDEVPAGVFVTHAGTARTPSGKLVTAGGRVLNVTALGRDAAAARGRRICCRGHDRVRWQAVPRRHRAAAHRGRAEPRVSEQEQQAPQAMAEPAAAFEELDVGGPLVGIVMGSKSDMAAMEAAEKELSDRGISSEVRVMSAHREPDKVAEYAKNARMRGLRVIIAGAGLSAALPGVVAAHSDLPVIGVPLTSRTSVAGGLDALLSIAQMPPGVPVACVGVDNARNAAVLAARILAA